MDHSNNPLLAAKVISSPSSIDQWVQSHHPALTENLLGAKSDLEAVMNWLEEFKHSRHTYRAYEKESLRFLYWLRTEYNIALSDLRKNHIHQYRSFLLDPQPHEFWCSPPSMRKKSRQTNQWKPFSGPLSYRSIQTAMTILQGMFEYLMNARYLTANPFSLIKQKLTESFDSEERKIQITERILSIQEFEYLLSGLSDMRSLQSKSVLWVDRGLFMLMFLSYMGLRVSEFVQAKWSNFIFTQERWWLVVTGKGQKTARIPVNQHCLDVINKYRMSLLIPPLGLQELTDLPICCAFTTGGELIYDKPLSERSVHSFCKEIAQAAKIFAKNDMERLKLDKFSPHWLRHFSASIQALAEIPFEMIKAHHRHSKDETTRLYLHHEDEKRHDWSQKLNINDIIARK